MDGSSGLLTIREVASCLRLSQRAIWNMLQDGRFGPGVIRLGRAVRFRGDELSAWISAGCPSRDVWAKLNQGV